METNQFYNSEVGDCCHPFLKKSFKPSPVDTSGENCFQNSVPCNPCCLPDGRQDAFRECVGDGPLYQQLSNSRPDRKDSDGKHLHCVAHSCPLGKIVCCSGCRKDDCGADKDIIKATEICSPPPDYRRIGIQNEEAEEMERPVERPCCAEKSSRTEARICRCNLMDPVTSKRCECECGATILKPQKLKSTKRVRFEDQGDTNIDCEQAFRNLEAGDIKHLCNCCKECAITGEEQCVGNPVLVYELPEPTFEDKSVTQRDFCWQKIPPRELPPWHPCIRDRWRHIDVPSLTETTYQSDFRPQPVLQGDRPPVYLAPQREERIDPCKQLTEEYVAFKKTSTGPSHVYHSSCEMCDADLHRVHLHECDASQLPPQYQCHGDGHLCEPAVVQRVDHQHCAPAVVQRVDPQHCEPTVPSDYPVCEPTCHAGNKFTLCEVEDPSISKYWWKRSCCGPENKGIGDLPPDLMKPQPCLGGYTTVYKHDYRNPKTFSNGRNDANCIACEYCKGERTNEKPTMLCTKDPRQPLITQRGGFL